MPSCVANARGRRAKMTLYGVIGLPNWRLITQLSRRSTGFRDSIGDMRMMMLSFCRSRHGCVLVSHAPAVMCERQRAQQRAEGDAGRDVEPVPHAALRRAAQVATIMRSVGT